MRISDSPDCPECLSIRQASKRLGISKDTLARAMKRGDGPPSLMIGRRRLIRLDHLVSWLDERGITHRPNTPRSEVSFR